jgi:hypothetical protein
MNYELCTRSTIIAAMPVSRHRPAMVGVCDASDDYGECL